MKYMVKEQSLPNIPWEDKPADCSNAVWRYRNNPIIPRDAIPTSNSIFNSAVVPFNGEFTGVFRVDHTDRAQKLHVGRSKDGISWEMEHECIDPTCVDDAIATHGRGYDPRVCLVEGKYYVVWCNSHFGPTIGIAETTDFKNFHQLENAFLPYNRNGVLFPRKINGKYIMLSRPSDASHTAFGDIFLSQSPDLTYWGGHRHVMSAGGSGWQGLKIGAGPMPIETSEGWLMFYHGVLMSCNGFVYAWGAALLDLDQPWKVITRGKHYLMCPTTLYECVGDVPNVTFPVAALCDGTSGRLAIYYGAADTVVALAFTTVDEVIDFIRADPVRSRR